MKKPDNSENSNRTNNDLSNFGQKRSSKFDDLTGSTSRPNNPNQSGGFFTKSKLKKTWKWISIAIYLFLAGLGVTGFIQSCVLRTSSTVGAGVELYNSKEGIAPYATTFGLVEKSMEVPVYDSDGNPVIENGKIKTQIVKYYEIERKSKENYLTSNATISEIKSQLQETYGDKVASYYGIYDNWSSALRILGTNGEEFNTSSSAGITGDVDNNGLLKGDKDDKYIFTNNRIINYLDANSIAYQPVNNWYDINYFVVKRPDNWDSLSNAQKNYYGNGLIDITNAFTAYETINGKEIEVPQINGMYVTKDVNADGVIDSDKYVQITDQNRIAKFKYALNAEVVTLSSYDNDNAAAGLLNSEAFARDYAQSIANILVKLPQISGEGSIVDVISGKKSTKADQDSATIFSSLDKSSFEKLVDSSKRYTLEQKNAILAYQAQMSSLMTGLGFGVHKQNYSDENSDDYVNGKDVPFVVEYLPETKNKKGKIIGTGSAAQKPITSWGDSWRLGPFYGLIVYPLSFIINGIMNPMPSMNGWSGVIAIVLAILITRVIVTLFTYKSLFATHKQQQLNPKKAKIDAKYEPFKGNREMEQRKRQELAKLYKSNNVSMVQPLKAFCISMPIFFAVWRVVQGIPDIKATTWLGIQFSLTSWQELFGGAWQYLPLLLMAAGTQAVSQLLPRILNKKRMKERASKAEIAALKKSNKTQNIVMIVFIIMSILFEAGVQIYWIVGGLWSIAQTLAVHHIVKSDWYKTKGYKYV